MIDRDRVLAELKRSEGCRLAAYRDSEGILTIGFGSIRYSTTGERVKEGDRISLKQAEAELNSDLDDACRDLDRSIPWAERLPVPAQETLVRMSFQLGINRLLGFKRMLAAVQNRDFAMAILEGFDSKWARQTPRRAVRVLRGFAVANSEGDL